MGLASFALGPARAVAQQLLDDIDIRELVTYRLWQSQAFDTVLGYNVDVFTEYANLRSVRLKADAQLTKTLNLNLEAGDVLFMLFSDDVPAGASSKDQIMDVNNHTYKVAKIHNVFNVVTAFQVEGDVK